MRIQKVVLSSLGELAVNRGLSMRAVPRMHNMSSFNLTGHLHLGR